MSTINPNYVPQSFINQQTGELKVDKTLAEGVQAGVQAKLDQLPDIGDTAFLAAIANLAPDDVATPGQMSALLDKFAAAAQKLSDSFDAMPFTGDVSKFLARAMIEFSGQRRQQAVEDRTMARNQAQAELLNQAGKQEQAAKEMMSGAIINAVVSGIGAGLSLGGSLASLKGQVSSIKNMTSASKQSSAATKTMDSLSAKADTAQPKLDIKIGSNRPGWTPAAKPTANKPSGTLDSDDPLAKLNTGDRKAYNEAKAAQVSATEKFNLAEKKSMAYQTGSQAADALGSTFKTAGSSADSGMQATAKKTEAEGSVDAAQAEYLKQIADGKKEIVDTMAETTKQIIAFIKEVQDAEIEAMRAITRG